MVPEILAGISPHPRLEDGGIPGDHGVDVHFAITGVGDVDRRDHAAILPALLLHRGHKKRGQPKAHRKHRRPTRRLRRTAEKWYERGGEAEYALVGDKGYGMSGAKRPRRAPDGFMVVHDDHPRAFPRLRDVRIEQGVVHAADDDFDGNSTRSDIRAGELPVTEVSRDEDDALPRGVRIEDPLESFTPLEQVEYSLATKFRQQRCFDDDFAEMTKRLSRQGIDVGGVLFRERCRNLALNYLPAHAKRCMRELAQATAEPPGRVEGNRA